MNTRRAEVHVRYGLLGVLLMSGAVQAGEGMGPSILRPGIEGDPGPALVLFGCAGLGLIAGCRYVSRWACMYKAWGAATQSPCANGCGWESTSDYARLNTADDGGSPERSKVEIWSPRTSQRGHRPPELSLTSHVMHGSASEQVRNTSDGLEIGSPSLYRQNSGNSHHSRSRASSVSLHTSVSAENLPALCEEAQRRQLELAVNEEQQSDPEPSSGRSNETFEGIKGQFDAITGQRLSDVEFFGPPISAAHSGLATPSTVLLGSPRKSLQEMPPPISAPESERVSPRRSLPEAVCPPPISAGESRVGSPRPPISKEGSAAATPCLVSGHTSPVSSAVPSPRKTVDPEDQESWDACDTGDDSHNPHQSAPQASKNSWIASLCVWSSARQK